MSHAPLNGTITLERVRELLSATVSAVVASSCLILFDHVVWSTAKQPARKKHRRDRWLSPRVKQRRRRAAAGSPADGVTGAIVKVESDDAGSDDGRDHYYFDEPKDVTDAGRKRGLMARAAEAVRLARFDDLVGLEIDEEMRRAVKDGADAWAELQAALAEREPSPARRDR